MPYPTRSSTKIIKNVVCRVLVVISLLLSLVSCEKEQDKVEDGVSLELAKERKANIGGVTYKLYFSIPADRSEAIMAESTIFFELFDLIPVILDFKEAKENILAVTSSDLNGSCSRRICCLFWLCARHCPPSCPPISCCLRLIPIIPPPCPNG